MMYLSGRLAFGVPCKSDSCGLWNISKEEYLDDNLFRLKDSDEYPFKNWGIEQNKLVPYRYIGTVPVANHVRAYVDMLYDCKFDELDGLFFDAIDSAKCRSDIFMLVYGKLRNLAVFSEVNKFMIKEFGNAWISYIDAVSMMADKQVAE